MSIWTHLAVLLLVVTVGVCVNICEKYRYPQPSLARARPLEKGSGETGIPKLFWLAKILLATLRLYVKKRHEGARLVVK